MIVVGAGHAGCEAALASARLGCKTMLLTLNLDRIAWQVRHGRNSTDGRRLHDPVPHYKILPRKKWPILHAGPALRPCPPRQAIQDSPLN